MKQNVSVKIQAIIIHFAKMCVRKNAMEGVKEVHVFAKMGESPLFALPPVYVQQLTVAPMASVREVIVFVTGQTKGVVKDKYAHKMESVCAQMVVHPQTVTASAVLVVSMKFATRIPILGGNFANVNLEGILENVIPNVQKIVQITMNVLEIKREMRSVCARKLMKKNVQIIAQKIAQMAYV